MNDVRVCHALWDRIASYDNPELRDILLDCNFTLDSIFRPKVDTNIDDVLAWAADKTDYTHVVVYDSGTCLTDPDGLRTAWYEFAKQDWLLAGEPYFDGVHASKYAINLHHWKSIGRPSIGSKGGSDIVATDILELGRKFGVQCAPLPHAILQSIIYMHPRSNTQLLLDQIRLTRSGAKPNADLLTISDQSRFIRMLEWAVGSNDDAAIFVYNTGDKLVNDDAFVDKHFDCIWGTASGFKTFAEWVTRGQAANCEIFTYDYNRKSLALWEHITRNWSGEDLYSFIREYDKDCHRGQYCWGNLQDYETPETASKRQENELCDLLGGRTKMLASWKSYQKLDHRFIHCDVTREYDNIVKNMSVDKAHVIWLNNVFYYSKSIRKDGVRFLQDQFAAFMESVISNGIDCKIHGQISGLYFADSPAVILDTLRAMKQPVYQCQIEVSDPEFEIIPGHPFLIR